MKNYLFTSARLGFRPWEPGDVDEMHEINTDIEVMEFFPTIPSREQTLAFIERMKKQFAEKSFCYFAVDKLVDETFIGFIGLSEQNYDLPFIDIGWRLKRSAWHHGFATEGARRCLSYACTVLKLDRVYAVAPKVNVRSEHIMKKIGLKKQREFEHPLLLHDERLKTCVQYAIDFT